MIELGRQKSILLAQREDGELENKKQLLRDVLQLLTVVQFATVLNVTPACVRRWLLEKRIASVKVGRRLIRIPATEAQRIIDEGLRPARRER